jgi:hypothetical protein
MGSSWYVIEHGQFPTEEVTRVAELINPFDIVVYETIHVVHMGFDPIGLEIIGAIKVVSYMNGNQLHGQSPGNISGAKKWPYVSQFSRNWFVNQPHARDAFYHGVTYIGLKDLDLSREPKR